MEIIQDTDKFIELAGFEHLLADISSTFVNISPHIIDQAIYNALESVSKFLRVP